MSTPAANTSLSVSARLLSYLGPPATILLTAYASPKTALLSPLALLHTGCFYRIWQRLNKADPSRRGEMEPMVWTYAISGTLGIGAVAILQVVTGLGLSTILFGSGERRAFFLKEAMRSTVDGLTEDELSRRAAMAHSWQNWIFNAIFMGVVGFFEELLKYSTIAYARRRYSTTSEGKKRNRAYLDYAISCALSFGLYEGLGFLYTSVVHNQETGARLGLTLFERIALGSSGHCLMAALTAMRAIRRDYYGDKMSWWAVVGPAVLLHGAQNFIALSFSASDGNVGWIHPSTSGKLLGLLGTSMSMVGIAAGLVRREWTLLKERDVSRR